MAHNLLDRLSGSHLPARWELEQEPSEPSERFEDRGVRGRSPDEVVQPREREYAETPTETTEGTPTPAAGKRRYVINGTEVALDAQQERDLVVYAIKQYAIQQQQAAQAQAAAPVVTNEAIAKVYDASADESTQNLIDTNLVEPDLVEAYPRTWRTAVGQIRWLADRSYDQEAKHNQMIQTLGALIQRVESTIAWLNHHKAAVEGQETPRRQGKQFVTGGKSGALLNKMVATSGRFPKAG